MNEASILIRLEESKDERIVEEITREAFWNLYVMGASEHFIIHNLRKSTDCIKSLSFVSMYNNKIVGSIFYSKSSVTDKNGIIYPTVTIAPVSVLPSAQGKGIGLKLIEYSLSIALKEKHCAVVILGNYDYYKRFGFEGGKRYKISIEEGKYYKNLLVLELQKGYFDNLKGFGKVTFSPVFNIDEAELEVFDKTFPFKEKIRTKSQEDFERIVSLLDE